jgi:type III secretion system FlhB-like substrate exporter
VSEAGSKAAQAKAQSSYASAENMPRVISEDAEELLQMLTAGAGASGATGTELEEVLASLGHETGLPPNAYAIIAEIVSFLYNCDREMAAATPPTKPV